MRCKFQWLFLAIAVVTVSCDKPEYTSDSIELLPENKAAAINLANVAGANALSSQDLQDIGLQLGRLPPPLGTPSDIKIESSPGGIVNAVSVGFGQKRVNLVRRQGMGWRVLNLSHKAGAH